MAQVAKCLPNKSMALSSKPQYYLKKVLGNYYKNPTNNTKETLFSEILSVKYTA
jgi:hypothetical protein